MYIINDSNSFKKDYKLIKKRNYDLFLLKEVLGELMTKGKLYIKFKPHKLSGNYSGHWECHIKPDWLLIWLQDDVNREITLVRTGTHSDLF
jgi:mRNA interferase YafQ